MDDFEFFLKKVNDFHGHTCTGIVLGTRMTLAGMRYLGLDPHAKNRNIIAYTEIDRCMADAVLVITGCSLGRRSLKYVDYGKFAFTLIEQTNGRAVRVIVKEDFGGQNSMEETIQKISTITDEKLITLQKVTVDISEYDLPGYPKRTAQCSVCGEKIMDGRDLVKDGIVCCRACAQGKYYKEG
ncbi:MAG TPA: FmdE family protein [Candidatus Limnocylindrales bacterium]|nr:FmdE family protein [Candidatus Limnocylindrales bacterium]